MNNIIMIILSVLLNAAAQIFIRKGMLSIGTFDVSNFFGSISVLMTNVWLWGAFLCYALSIVLWLSVLSKVEVSYAYPYLSIGYIVVAVAGYMLFNESLTKMRILGIVVICIGVYLISRSE